MSEWVIFMLSLQEAMVFKKLVEKFDWVVYKLSFRSINRMCARHDGAYAMLLKMSIDEWLEKHPIPESVKDSSKCFYDAITSLVKKKKKS